MREATAYRGEYLVFACPYCGHKHYRDIEDDRAAGRIEENGQRETCQQCNMIFRLMPRY